MGGVLIWTIFLVGLIGGAEAAAPGVTTATVRVMAACWWTVEHNLIGRLATASVDAAALLSGLAG